jgi:hypothetical protein
VKNGPYILVKAPENYPGKKYRDKYCYEHVLVYWQNTGVVPGDNEQIHHKDDDKHNNQFSNLEKINKGAHQKLHGERSPSNLVKFKCPGCQNIFFRRRGNTFLIKGGIYAACSRECTGVISYIKIKDIKEYEIRILDNIVDEFK